MSESRLRPVKLACSHEAYGFGRYFRIARGFRIKMRQPRPPS